MRSIERHLAGWILGATGLGTLLLGLLAYLVILDELNEAFDQNLAQVAQTLADQWSAVSETGAGLGAVAVPRSARRPIRPDDVPLVVTAWTAAGQLRFSTDLAVGLPFRPTAGMRRERLSGVEWDVFTAVRAGVVVQAAQPAAAQEQEAVESATRLVLPFAGLIAVLGGLLIYALRRGLQPLDEAAALVAARSAVSLDPIADAHMPREIRPLVGSINALMQRLQSAFDHQRRFVADAAHELRTPVTALGLQLQLLERAPDEAARQVAVHELRAGVERTQHLIEQLLHLSRAEPGAAQQRLETLRLDTLARDCVGRLSVKAEHHGIDLGAQADVPVSLHGDREEIGILLNNLVENALRHCPPGSTVDVVVECIAACPTLRVIDSGPGIAPDERERMFDRFHRGEPAAASPQAEVGSGLGLAIVKAIAQRHGAQASLHTAPSGQGLEARVVFAPGPDVGPDVGPGLNAAMLESA